MSLANLIIILIFLSFLTIFTYFTVHIARQYERAVVFRLGRLSGEKGAGLFLIIPLVDRMLKVDMRVRQLDVPRQTIITKDNISIDVDAIIYYQVIDASRAIIEVEDFESATALIAQTTLRDVLGRIDLDTILSDRDSLNLAIQTTLKNITEPWGIQVNIVTIRDVALPENMLRAMARQAEAEREKRARIILAEGEFQASERMGEAAHYYEQNPVALKLREFQTLAEIAKERNLIVVTSGSENLGTTVGCVKALDR